MSDNGARVTRREALAEVIEQAFAPAKTDGNARMLHGLARTAADAVMELEHNERTARPAIDTAPILPTTRALAIAWRRRLERRIRKAKQDVER